MDASKEKGLSQAEDKELFDIEVRLLLEAVFMKYKYDFRKYSLASVKRRLTSALSKYNVDNVSALQERVLREPEFFNAILQFLTISTTEMFRDPEYFKMFREKVIPYLRSYPSLKIWVAGCSTGEEAYSFAVVLKEEGLYERSMIYATDINPVSLEKARNGVYRIDDMQKYTVNYQKSGAKQSFADYYSAFSEMAAIDPALKKNIVFADHSLATDAVFAEMNYVSCRNVLIYFEPELQDRAIGLFHDSLGRQCFLGIGEKETLKFSKYESHFEVWSSAERIYRKIR